MFFLLLVLGLGLADPLLQDFNEWQILHELTYENVAEKNERFAIWKENYAKVQIHNAEAKNGTHTFFLGMTQFAHYTNEEYRSKFLGLNPKRDSRAKFTVKAKNLQDLPKKWDWKTQGVVTGVKNQKACGSCWAFSAVASMEGRYALDSGNLTSFSEQELVDCTRGGKDTCDEGGEMHDGILEISLNHGGKINTERQYPYKGTDGRSCKAKDKLAIDANITGYANVTSGNETALQEAVYKYPVISIGIDASQFSFQMYVSGVYNEPKCKSDADDLDHGVSLTGWGHQLDPAADYWIVKNSWGKSWGERGYIYMSRGQDNQCGVATDACFALSPSALED